MKTLGIQPVRWTRFGLIAIVLLICQSSIPTANAGALAASPLKLFADCGINPDYIGMDNTHLSYNAAACTDFAGATNVELVATMNSTTTLLVSHASNGIYHHTGLTPMEVTYQYRVTYLGYPPVLEDYPKVKVNVGSIRGTLDFDEVVTSQSVDQGFWVTVPAGLTFQFDGAIYDDSSAPMFEVLPGGALNIKDTGIRNGGYFKTPVDSPQALTIKNSTFLTRVKLEGAGQISESTFYSDIALQKPAAISLKKNILIGAVIIPDWLPGSPTLLIEDNSFIGGRAFDYSGVNPLSIGSNYFGDKGGLQGGQSVFLEKRGARISGSGYPKLTLADPLPSGDYPADPKLFPSIWTIGFIIGQNTLPHATSQMSAPRLIQGRETLVSIDLGVSTQVMRGMTAYANFDGQKIPAQPIGTISRDIDAYSSADVVTGKNTLNFILPGTTNPLVNLEVILDTKGVSGPQEGRPVDDKLSILTMLLSFKPASSFSIEVIPIDLGGLCPSKSAKTADLLSTLYSELPAMLPISSSNLTVDVMPVYHFKCWPGSFLSTGLFAEAILAEISILTHASGSTYDRTIGVFPAESLGVGLASDGVNAWFARGTLAVDELKPMAAFHELGHSYNLYTAIGGEEYELHPDLGLPFQNATAFAPEGVVIANGLHGRFLHFPALESSDTPYLWDTMGIPDQAWPIPSTYDGIHVDSAHAAVASSPVPAAQPANKQAEDPRQLFLWGVMQADTPGYYHFIPGSLQIFDITGLDASRWNTETCTQKIPGDPTLTYNLNVMDNQGRLILNLWTDSSEPDTSLPKVMPFCTVFQIPLAILGRAASYNLVEGLSGPSMMVQQRATQMGALTDRPADGSTLGDQVSLGWTTGSGPVMHWVWFSRDGGTTWQPAGLPTDDPSLTYATGFLPAGNNITIQTISSDGFQQVIETIPGLKLANHPPQVSILFPWESASAPQDTAWNFQGRVLDVEDGAKITGSWSSNLDGVLGTGNNLWGVALSAGQHTITFTATDLGGLTTSQQIHLHVGPVTTADLAVGADSLKLIIAGGDPLASPSLPKLGATNILELHVPGVGVPITATLSIYITMPGGSETQLLTQAQAIQPFATGVWMASFVPSLPGDYHIRAVIESASLPDPNITNNQYTWTFMVSPQAFSSKIYLPICVKSN